MKLSVLIEKLSGWIYCCFNGHQYDHDITDFDIDDKGRIRFQCFWCDKIVWRKQGY